MKRERDERLEAAGLVLQRAHLHQVIDALLHRLDVAVEHRDVGAHAEADARCDGSPGSDRRRTCRGRSSGARAPRRSRRRRRAANRGPASPSSTQHLLVGHPVVIGEERDLDGGEAFQVDVRADLLQAAQQIRVVAERQLRVEAVDDVDFGERLVRRAGAACRGPARRVIVCAPGIARLQPRERAEQARRFADVGRLEPQVVIEVGARAVAALALAIGQPAERQQIGRVEQRTPSSNDSRSRRLDLLGDVAEPGAERCHWRCNVSSELDPDHLRANRPRARAIQLRHNTRCQRPSTSSPPLICIVSEWPSSIARRCESAFARSQSECSGSLCGSSDRARPASSRKCLMSVDRAPSAIR